MSVRAKDKVRFGTFEVDFESGELRKHGLKVRLQGKPLQVLEALLENPGRVVTREDLIRRLWQEDTFVDSEAGLNTAVKRLRVALGDSTESPRYIETLSRNGYRFIGTVEADAGQTRSPGTADSGTLTTTKPPAKRRWTWAVVTAFALATAAAAVFWPRAAGEVRYRQITFRRGQVWGARFAPDGQAIVYAAQWDGGPRQLYLTNPASPESRLLGFQDASLAAVSRQGELALQMFDGTLPITGGELLRVPMHGGAPMRVTQSVMSADWSPDGKQLAVVRALDGKNQLEYPAGAVLYRTAGWLGSVRVAPDGKRVAFVDHPVRHDDGGVVRVAGVDGAVRGLTGRWSSVSGVAWHPSGKEVWFTAATGGAARSLWAVAASGKVRAVGQSAGSLHLEDIASSGRVLLSRDSRRLEMAIRFPGDPVDRDISWLDWSRVQQISPDGKSVLFDESGEGAGGGVSAYLYRTRDGNTVRVGEGRAMALTPDGHSVLVLADDERHRLRLIPIGPGDSRDLPPTGLRYQWARFLPDGKTLLVLASQDGGGLRVFRQSLGGGLPVALTPPVMVRDVAVSPDGNEVALLTADRRLAVFRTTASGPERVLPTQEPLAPLLWSADGKSLLVQHLKSYTAIPARVSRFDIRTGEIRPWGEFGPRDPMGVNSITRIVIAPDERTTVFNYRRVSSELFVATGYR
ncbi:MAG: winged helix-turn-helix domain-containing protein [Bryobacteraceae bacterium]